MRSSFKRVVRGDAGPTAGRAHASVSGAGAVAIPIERRPSRSDARDRVEPSRRSKVGLPNLLSADDRISAPPAPSLTRRRGIARAPGHHIRMAGAVRKPGRLLCASLVPSRFQVRQRSLTPARTSQCGPPIWNRRAFCRSRNLQWGRKKSAQPTLILREGKEGRGSIFPSPADCRSTRTASRRWQMHDGPSQLRSWLVDAGHGSKVLKDLYEESHDRFCPSRDRAACGSTRLGGVP